MKIEEVYREIEGFSRETHGSTNYYKDTRFVMAENGQDYAPLSFLVKKVKGFGQMEDLLACGFICDSWDLHEFAPFPAWYEKQFGRKFKRTLARHISILYAPNDADIVTAIEAADKFYTLLRKEHILLNNKNLPVQLGEWYAKRIFGLKQNKSTSQRGFDLYLGDERVEIKVHWGDFSSPKGVKMRKSLVALSTYCIIMYISVNLMIREVCFLDASFAIRKFTGKGHTLFLKDTDISQYFFSNSGKHSDKVVNPAALLRFASPAFAMKISDMFAL